MNNKEAINVLYTTVATPHIHPDEQGVWDKAIEMAIKALAFKDYFDDLYGEGLEIANWHLNGELEPFDSFYESANDCSFDNQEVGGLF